MTGKISQVLGIVLLMLALVGVVSADGGINSSANGYLGGDNLFCNATRGCYLLNENGTDLGGFPQGDIQAALATCAASASNVIIASIQGTFGPFTLSAVYDGPNADPVCSLQINAFEGEGKESKPFSFAPKTDGNYSPIPQPVEEQELVTDYCSMWSVGDAIFKLDHIYYGSIESLNPAAGTAVIQLYGDTIIGGYRTLPDPETVRCDELIADI